MVPTSAEFVIFMRVHMRDIQLWGILSGEVPCPSCPVAPMAPTLPTPPALAADASDADKAAAKTAHVAAMVVYDHQVSEYSNALATYRDDLIVYTQWCDEDVRAAAVLTSSVLPQFASEFMVLGSAAEMWTSLRQRYQPSRDFLYLCVVRQDHALQQGDSTVDEFYTQISAIWRQLDSLCTGVCGTCPCCQSMRSDLEFQWIHEFLSRLRLEFEACRAQLFARGSVPLSEVISEIRAEETRLRGAGLLAVPSMLAVMPTAALGSSRSAPSLLPTPYGEGRSPSSGAGRPHSCSFCGYCQKPGHPESDCFKKLRDMRNREHTSSFGSRASSSTSTNLPLIAQDIVRLKRLLAASGSSSTGTAVFVTVASSTTGPSSTQSGISPWVLDYGASFHILILLLCPLPVLLSLLLMFSLLVALIFLLQIEAHFPLLLLFPVFLIFLVLP